MGRKSRNKSQTGTKKSNTNNKTSTISGFVPNSSVVGSSITKESPIPIYIKPDSIKDQHNESQAERSLMHSVESIEPITTNHSKSKDTKLDNQDKPMEYNDGSDSETSTLNPSQGLEPDSPTGVSGLAMEKKETSSNSSNHQNNHQNHHQNHHHHHNDSKLIDTMFNDTPDFDELLNIKSSSTELNGSKLKVRESHSNQSHNHHPNSSKSNSNPTFAPLNVPFHRRRETFAQLVGMFLPEILRSWNLICIFFPPLWPIYLCYLFIIFRDTSHENGSRPIAWVRNLPIWQWYSDYFPSQLIKEAELDPQRKYIFGYHPHGIISMGVIANFVTNADRIEKTFPHITIRPLTLDFNFKIPFSREYLLSLGMASVSKRSIRNILNKGPGNACLIAVGGAEEALEAKPDRANLILARRYGFVKMALECGADLVPTFAFGENQLYSQVDNDPGTTLYSLQQLMKRTLSFTMPIFYGRGVFNYKFGILPRRVPLTIVTGKPITVTHTPHPTESEIHELHTQYLDAVTDLYNRNKGEYWVGSDPPEIQFH